MSKRLTCEVKNFLVNKMNMSEEQVDEKLGMEVTVEEHKFREVWAWASENTATASQRILWGFK